MKNCRARIEHRYANPLPLDIPETCYTKQEAKISDIDIKEFTMQHLVANGIEGPLSDPISNEKVERLNMATFGQHKNEHWHALRKGRITSSIILYLAKLSTIEAKM